MVQFLRGAAAFVLMLSGTALSFLSIVAAFGWGHHPTSLGGTVIAILGLSLVFGGYWLIRDFDGAPLAAAFLQLALGLGSTLLVYGLLAVFLSGSTDFPMGYFIATGCLSVLGLVRFRAYRKRS